MSADKHKEILGEIKTIFVTETESPSQKLSTRKQ